MDEQPAGRTASPNRPVEEEGALSSDGLSIGSDVKHLLGPEAIARLRRNPRRPEQCFRCESRIPPGETNELVVLRFQRDGRSFAHMVIAHRACQPSAVLEGRDPGIGRHEASALVVPAVRARPPRALVIVDLMVEVLQQVNLAGEVTDVRLRKLLDAGFELLADPDLESLEVVPVPDFVARWGHGRLTIVGPGDFVFLEDRCPGPAPWEQELKVHPSLVVAVGLRMGLDEDDGAADFARAVRDGRVVIGALAAVPDGQRAGGGRDA